MPIEEMVAGWFHIAVTKGYTPEQVEQAAASMLAMLVKGAKDAGAEPFTDLTVDLGDQCYKVSVEEVIPEKEGE